MIVNYTEAGWQIITQRAHGLLAAQICVQWKKENQPVRWMETLIATAEHDDVYNEFENEDLLSDQGGPVNFKMTTFKKDQCERLMDMAITKSGYVALLISRHIQFVFGKEQDAEPYCNALRKKEKQWLKETKVSKAEIDASYQLLEFCDAFSLLICQDLMQPEHRKIEISNGPDGKFYALVVNSKHQLHVEPWPFESKEFSVVYESRVLDQLVFKDTDAFRAALLAAKVTTNELTITSEV
jgi:hypothetical protein